MTTVSDLPVSDLSVAPTTSDHSAPDLSGYRAVHTALRRGTHALAEAAVELDPADRRRVAAYARYWKGFAGEVLAHHTIEDDICFPALVERIVGMDELITRTDADHHRLDELMSAAAAAVGELAAGRRAPELPDVLAELDELMHRHLDFEDAEILPQIDEHLDGEEWAALEKQAQKHLGIGTQAAFSVPFIASMLDLGDLQEVFGSAPGAFKVLYRLTRKRYNRLAAHALGSAARVAVPLGR
jgi:hemerythrin-like domain-containing protein